MSVDWAQLWALADHGLDEEPAATSPLPAPARLLCTGHVVSTGLPCKNSPIHGSNVCHAHGGRAPQVREKAAQRVQEAQALALARKAAGDLDLAPFGDPLDALETAIGYGHALALRLAKLVEALPDDQLRYAGRISEQIRAEVGAAQVALRDLRQSAEAAARLGLSERRARIEEHKVEVIEKALRAALAACGLGQDGQRLARKALYRELRVIEGG